MADGTRRALVFLFWLGLALWTFLGLGGAIGDGDEVIHAEIVREMLRSGDYLNMRWYGVVLSERPQLPYWLALPFVRLIDGEVGLRLGSACCSFATLGVVYVLGLRLWKEHVSAALATLLVAGAPSFHVFTRTLMSEPPYILAVTLALAGTIWVQTDRRGLLLTAAGLGAAVAAKSLAVAVPALALMPWLAIGARKTAARRDVLLASALFLALALPFFVLGVLLQGEQFLREHIGFHLLQRAKGGFVGIRGGFFTYVRVILHSDGPWTAAMLLLGTAWACARARHDRALAILGSYSVLVFVGMSALGTRLPHYVLPIYPAAALGSADCVRRIIRWQAALRPHVASLAVLALALCQLLISRPYPGGRDYLFERPYGRQLGRKANKLAGPGQRLYAYEWYGLSLGYYADRPITLLTAQQERFAAIDFEMGAIHRAHIAALVPPNPEPAGSQLLLGGDIQTLLKSRWFKVDEVLAAAPPYLLVRATVLPDTRQAMRH